MVYPNWALIHWKPCAQIFPAIRLLINLMVLQTVQLHHNALHSSMDIHHTMLIAQKPSQRTIIAMTVLCAAFIAMPTAWGQALQATSTSAPNTSVSSAKRSIRTLDSIVAVVNKEVITRQEL